MIRKDAVVAWLDVEGRTAQDIEGEEGVAWHIVVSFPSPDGPSTHIIAPEDGEYLLIRRGTNVAERHRKALLALDEQSFRTFKFNLLRDLLLSGVQYRLLLQEDHNLSAFSMDTILRGADVTRHQFYEALQRVHDATLLAVVHVRHVAGEAT